MQDSSRKRGKNLKIMYTPPHDEELFLLLLSFTCQAREYVEKMGFEGRCGMLLYVYPTTFFFSSIAMELSIYTLHVLFCIQGRRWRCGSEMEERKIVPSPLQATQKELNLFS